MVENDQLISEKIKKKDFLLFNIKPRKNQKRYIKCREISEIWKKLETGMIEG